MLFQGFLALVFVVILKFFCAVSGDIGEKLHLNDYYQYGASNTEYDRGTGYRNRTKYDRRIVYRNRTNLNLYPNISITGSNKMNAYLYKYIASLQRNGVHFCSGSVIGADIVLTAAKCLKDNHHRKINIGDIRIYVGIHQRMNVNYTKGYEIDYATIHDNHKYRQFKSDIAVIVLKHRVYEFKGHLGKIELAKNRPHPGRVCTLVCWNRLFPNGPISNELSFIDLVVMQNGDCAINKYYYREQLCLQPENDLSIGEQGEYGGMLVCNGEQSGVGQFRLKLGGYFYATDVSYHRDWILENNALILKANSIILLIIPIRMNFQQNLKFI